MTIAAAAPVRVLIVDDAPAARLLLRQCLTASGRFQVVGEAVDGSDGIHQATIQQPDIILLDVAMPIMDGLEAVPHLARCSPGSLIIMLSGFTADATASEAMGLGAGAYIEKKHHPEEVLRQITDAWESVCIGYNGPVTLQ